MSFENRKIKVTMFKMESPFSDAAWNTALESVKKFAVLPLEDVTEEPSFGWASGKSELNTEFLESDCRLSDAFLYLSFRVSVRKVASGIFKALLRKKCDEYMKNNHLKFVDSRTMKELRREALDKLLPETIPTLKTAWTIIGRDGTVFAGISGDRLGMAFRGLFEKTFGIAIDPFPFGVSCKMVEETNSDGESDTGADFLTELFRRADTALDADDFHLEPPFDFVSADQDADCIRSCSFGEAAQKAAEVSAAIRSGKKLKRAKITLNGLRIPEFEELVIWNFSVGRNGVVSGLSTPEGEEQDFPAVQLERIRMVAAVFQWLAARFMEFKQQSQSADYATQMKQWREAER